MNINEIEKLVEILKNSDLSELIVEQDGIRIQLKREKQVIISTQKNVPHTLPFISTEISKEEKKEKEVKEIEDNLIAIESPMVGTFYRSSSSDASPFTKEGEIVHEDTIVGIIEAMKIFNQIEAKVKGKIVKVLVENEEPVEFGQKLFLVEPI
jgi:acetyl-CoA carboxylase biotin carboxyl carrier protein